MANLSAEKVQELKSGVKGRVITPSDGDYDEVRTIWNAMIDKRPALIVQCTNADDVALSLAFGQENDLEISIRGVGHNIAGNSICDDGLMIDLSTMREVKCGRGAARRAYVDPGATLGDFDKAAQAHGLATPVGYQLDHRHFRPYAWRRHGMVDEQVWIFDRQRRVRGSRHGRWTKTQGKREREPGSLLGDSWGWRKFWRDHAMGIQAPSRWTRSHSGFDRVPTGPG